MESSFLWCCAARTRRGEFNAPVSPTRPDAACQIRRNRCLGRNYCLELCDWFCRADIGTEQPDRIEVLNHTERPEVIRWHGLSTSPDADADGAIK
jgi:hypothetical protein